MADFRYPYRRLEKSDDYLHIKVVDYKPPGIPSLGSPSTTSNYNQVTVYDNIYLPVPQDVADSNSVDWGDDTLNPIAATGVEAAESIIGSAGFAPEVFNQIQKIMGVAQDQTVSGNAQGAIQSGFAAMAVNQLGGNVSLEGLLSRSTGQVLNPNMELLFKGVKLRSFTFSYDLVARDSGEASIIKGMIRTLKVSMAPKKTTGASTGALFVSAPRVFQLEFKKGPSKHPFLPTFKPMALVSMNVNYTGSGTYATYTDGTPVHLNMQLSFQEINPVYAEDYSESNAQIGVGY